MTAVVPPGGIAPVAPGAMRRVTVVTPRTRVDVALPAQGTIAELLPQLVRLAGAGGQGDPEHPGWTLARFGEAPLPTGTTVATAAVRDGEVLYLSPKRRRGVPLMFDDVVDAIASAAGTRQGAWNPRAARRLGITGGAVGLAAATLLCYAATAGSWLAPVCTGVLALAFLFGAGAASRAYGDAETGVTIAAAGIPSAFLVGASALPPHLARAFAAGSLSTGLAVVTLYGVLGALIVAHRIALFSAMVTVGGLGAIAAAVAALTGLRGSAVGTGLAVVATAACATAPMVALRLGRLPLPRVPADMAAFRSEEEATLGADVLDRTVVAEEILAGLIAALGLLTVGGTLAALRGATDAAPVWTLAFAGLLGVGWLLRSRSYEATAQRVVAVAGGLVVLAELALALVISGQRLGIAVLAVIAAVLGLVCLVYSRRTVRGLRSPYWSRVLDIAEFLALVALLPVGAVILGLYEAVRGAIG